MTLVNPPELKAADYVGQPVNIRQGQQFRPFNCLGWLSIKVLEFLNGKPWDDVALGYVHALRPSHIRVTDGMVQLDAQTWRVTVFVKEDGKTIESIEQEVEVGLPDRVTCGAALRTALHYGIDSPQMDWERIDGGIYHDGINGKLYKTVGDKLIPHPNNDRKDNQS